jgi:ATP-dependent HslUV protease ATP-binding subunit HslU
MADLARKPSGKDKTVRPPVDFEVESTPAESLTPKQIVAELDRYIIGQNDAKRAVAVALRNRYRRQQLPEEMRREVHPKNILMIGSTGVGKTEIARRVARIVDAPFLKVEATKFTEVGYVGRDVESIVRDLVEIAISMLHNERTEQVKEQAAALAVERLTEILSEQELIRKPVRTSRRADDAELDDEDRAEREAQAIDRRRRREQKRLRQLLDDEAMEDETVEIEMESDSDFDDSQQFEIIAGNPEELQDTFYEFLDGLLPRRRTRRKVSVREARRILAQQEANRMVDFDAVVEAAMRRVEDAAVVFIDEIDKTISGGDSDSGPDVSGAGVQRDLLPIVEGSAVMTRYGPVHTDHILFIAAGSFHGVRPSDLIPELQGRFPIRVELQSLTEEDLLAILSEPQNALTKQYMALLATEKVTVDFTDTGLREVARIATLVNQRTEDIGARRLQTILERVLEEVSFNAPEMADQHVSIDESFVQERVGDVADDEELSNFIL